MCSRCSSVLMSGQSRPQAPLAKEIDVDLEGRTEPGDSDELAARAHGVDGLTERVRAGESLFRAAAGAIEDDVSTIAAGQGADPCTSTGSTTRASEPTTSAPNSVETRQASSRTSTVTIRPAPLLRTT